MTEKTRGVFSVGEVGFPVMRKCGKQPAESVAASPFSVEQDGYAVAAEEVRGKRKGTGDLTKKRCNGKRGR